MTNDKLELPGGDNFRAVFCPHSGLTHEDLVALIEAIGVAFVGAGGREKFEDLPVSLREHFMLTV